MAYTTIAKDTTASPNSWYIDSGATDHLCSSRKTFSTLRCLLTPIPVHMGNNTTTFATGKGTIILSNRSHVLRLTNVLYVPNICYNLLSVSKLDSSHYNILFSQEKAIVLDQKGGELAVACLVNGLYQIYQSQAILNLATTRLGALPARLKALPLDLWHQRLGYLHHSAVKQLSTLADGVKIAQESRQFFCRQCLEGKQHKIYNRQPSNSKCMILYIDDYTRMTWADFLKTKPSIEVIRVFREFRALVETATGLRIQRFRSDNGKGKYDNKEFK